MNQPDKLKHPCDETFDETLERTIDVLEEVAREHLADPDIIAALNDQTVDESWF